MPQGFEWIAALPPWMQALFMLGMGLGLAGLGRVSFKNGLKNEPAVSTKDVVIQSASIADMSWTKDLVTNSSRVALASEQLAGELKRCADELGTIRQVLAEDAESRENDRNYRRGREDGARLNKS